MEEQEYNEPEATEAPVEAEQQEPEVTRDWSEDDEAEARAFGWKSPDEWEGDLPAGYIDNPRRFMERAENFRPFKKLREQMTEQERAFQDRLERIERVSQRAMERQQEQHKRELDQVRGQMRQAVEDGDVERYDRLSRRADELSKSQEPEAKPDPKQGNAVPPEWDKALQSFASENEWFNSDPVMRRAAEAIHAEALQNGIRDPETNLTHVTRKMREYFPQKFGQAETPKRQSAAVADGLSLGGGKKAGFDTLPKEAKSAFKQFVSQGLFEDTPEGRQEYFDEYNG